MAKQTEKAELKKGKAFFNLTGNVKITDYTYKLNEISERTGYKYSRLNLGIETSAGNIVYCEAMGGFYPNKKNVCYVSSKEDIKNKYTIDWEDRFDDVVLETIHNTNFIKIGVEQYDKDGQTRTFTKRFLNWFDGITYLKEHIENGTKVNVSGSLKYSIYNDKIQIKKEITSIYLANENAENKATFVQTILLDNDSVGKLDKETGEYPISARVIDYTKMYGDKEIKMNIPFAVNYSLKEHDNPELTKKLLTRYFKVKRGTITELAVEGNIVEGTPTGEVTEDDLPDDMRELIELGLYTKEEILGKMVVKGDRVSKMVITKPYIQSINEGDDKKSIKTFFVQERYKEEDLILDFLYEDDEDDEPPFDMESESTEGEDDWLKDL